MEVQERTALTSQLEAIKIEHELPSFRSAVAVLTVRHCLGIVRQCLGIDRGSQKQSGSFRVKDVRAQRVKKNSRWSDQPCHRSPPAPENAMPEQLVPPVERCSSP